MLCRSGGVHLRHQASASDLTFCIPTCMHCLLTNTSTCMHGSFSYLRGPEFPGICQDHPCELIAIPMAILSQLQCREGKEVVTHSGPPCNTQNALYQFLPIPSQNVPPRIWSNNSLHSDVGLHRVWGAPGCDAAVHCGQICLNKPVHEQSRQFPQIITCDALKQQCSSSSC